MDAVEIFAVAFLSLLSLLTLLVLGLGVQGWRKHWGREELGLLATIASITGLGAAGVAWL